MKFDFGISEDAANRGSVERKKKRAKDRTLRNSSGNEKRVRTLIVNGNLLKAVGEVGFE